MSQDPPKIDPRKFSDLERFLRALAPHYTPEWSAEHDDDPAVALLKIFSQMSEGVISRLNQAPRRNFIAFLNMLGAKRLPALPARVPLRFILAEGAEQGLTREILVPRRTRASADATEARPDELPFETENDLLATPSQLASVFAVDPQKDAIYQTPPGFLTRPMPDRSQAAYRIISFSAAGSDAFQLDVVEGLEENDLLRIGEGEQPDFFFIKEISGTIIRVEEKLPRDYQPGTPVEKVTKFYVYESKNLQEHVLYLGDPDLFNVESPAVFTALIKHLEGEEEGVQPLGIVWEYWGAVEGEDENDWRPFQIDDDGSSRLSRNGAVKLRKPLPGEIAEREINAITSRWIRCRLIEALPQPSSRKLPVLDNITFQVQSAGDGLLPDLAFHNDTPLDFGLAFFPFGFEPKLFDRFYLGSEEIFSKRGAEIAIDIRLDSIAILAAPAAVAILNDEGVATLIRLFARGTGGRLVEFRIDPNSSDVVLPINHDFPPDTAIALPDLDFGTEAAPALIEFEGATHIFVTAENGRLFERFIRDEQEFWINHERPLSVNLKSDPAAKPQIETSSGNHIIKVYVIGEDGRLYILNRTIKSGTTLFDNLKGTWQRQAGVTQAIKPAATTFISSPYATTIDDNGTTRIVLFLRGNDNKLYEYDLLKSPNLRSYDPGTPIDAKPFALLFNNMSETPTIVLDDTASRFDDVYVGLDVTLFGDTEGGQTRTIISYKIEGRDTGAEKRIALVDRDWDIVPNVQSEYEIATSQTFRENSEVANFSIILDENAADLNYEGASVQIDGGTPIDGNTPEIEQYIAAKKLAKLSNGWDILPSKGTGYSIQLPDGNVESGTAQGGGPIILLAGNARIEDGFYDGTVITVTGPGAADSQERAILSYLGGDKKIAVVDNAWEPLPENNSGYRIDNLRGIAKGGTGAGVYAKAFLKAADGNLLEINTKTTEVFNLGKPVLAGSVDASDQVNVDSAAYGYIEDIESPVDSEGKHIFVRGSQFNLWERLDDDAGGQPQWRLHDPPGDVELRHSPFLLKAITPISQYLLYSSTNKNAILELKLPTPFEGTPQVGTEMTLTLVAEPPEFKSGLEVEIVSADQTDRQVRKIGGFIEIFGSHLLYIDQNAMVEQERQWSPQPDTGYTYSIREIIHDGQVLDAAFSTIALQKAKNGNPFASSQENAYQGFTLNLDKDSSTDFEIVEYDGAMKIAKIEKPWSADNIPEAGDGYTIATKRDNKQAQGIGSAQARLAQMLNDGSEIPNKALLYRGRRIEFVESGVFNPITSYNESSRLIKVLNNWEPFPDENAVYRVVAFVGTVEGVTNNSTVTLDDEANDLTPAINELKIKFENKEYGIDTFVRRNNKNIVTLFEVPEPPVDPGMTSYTIDPEVSGDAKVIESNPNETKLLLGEEASEISDVYVGFEINIPKDSQNNYAINGYEVSDEGKKITINAELPDDAEFEYTILAVQGIITDFTLPTITLDNEAPKVPMLFEGLLLKITDGEGSGQTRKIISYDHNTRTVELNKAWESPIPPALSRYAIDIAHSGLVKGGSHDIIELDDGQTLDEDDIYSGLFIQVNSSDDVEEKRIDEYDGTNRIAKIEGEWSTPPQENDTYRIITKVKLQDAQNAFIQLDAGEFPNGASENPGAYDNLGITVHDPEDQTRTIISYEGGETKKAFVNENWDADKTLPARPTFSIVDHAGEAEGATFSIVNIPFSADVPVGDVDDLAIEIARNGGTLEPISRNIMTIRNIANDSYLQITVETAWTDADLPHEDDEFKVLRLLVSHRETTVGTATTMTIQDHGLDLPEDLEDGQIEIIDGPGADGIVREIEGYLPNLIVNDDTRIAARVIRVSESWGTGNLPTSDSMYEITGATFTGRDWRTYEDTEVTNITPELSWEYWNGRGWVVLKEGEHQFVDGTKNLLIDGKVEFLLPENIDLTDVAGQESIWIRARIVGGDYGQQTFTLRETVKGVDEPPPREFEVIKETKLVPDKSPIRPPLVVNLTISYTLAERQFPRQCLPFNNLQFIDQADANRTPDKRFMPFERLEDTTKAFYLGFLERFLRGPMKIFFAAKELPFDEAQKPKVVWSYRGEQAWKRLSFDDDTEGLIKRELLSLIGERDFTRAQRFGIGLFWIRGTLEEGMYLELPVLDGIYPNTTWAFQAETIIAEILGSSDGEPNQVFRFFKAPVLLGSQAIRVAEVLTLEEREALIESLGEEAIEEERDAFGNIVQRWILWTEVEIFFDSGPNDRHYKIDLAAGEIQFGDGRNGQIPPAGLNNIQAFEYRAVVGGAQGNVDAGQIQTLVTAIAAVDSVLNPVDAGGGTDTATVDQMLQIVPASLNNRQRAVTAEDFEWLAREASREIARVRCRPNINNLGRREIGWVTVVIVPNVPDEEMPVPSLELRRRVRRYLQQRSVNSIAAINHIFISGPSYRRINATMEVVAESIDVAAQVDEEIREKLRNFLHPLTGGPEGEGWDFGRDVAVSDLYAVLEDIEGVDHIEHLQVGFNGTTGADVVEIDADGLVANGEHTINITPREVSF